MLPVTKTRTSSSEPFAHATLHINPVPAARPRVSKWGTYYPKTYRDWKKAAAELLAKTSLPAHPCDGPVALLATFAIQKARTSKLTTPVGDLDNYVKALMDALNDDGRVWLDDKQVVTLRCMKRFASDTETPHIQFTIRELRELPPDEL